MPHIINGTVLTMEGQTFERGFVSYEGGRITAVGDMADFTAAGPDAFDAGGGFILPGFIDAHTHIGIHEESVGEMGNDINEMCDPITPHMRALDGIYPLEGYFPRAREAGVTSAVVAPGSANVIGGQAVALRLFGERVDDMVIKAPCAMKMALGENPKRVYGSKDKSPVTRMASAALLRGALREAQLYHEKQAAGEDVKFDMKWEALGPVLRREIPAHIHAHRVDDILTALRIAREFSIRCHIVHATDAVRAAKFLAEEDGVMAIAGPITYVSSKIETMGLSLENPRALFEAGVPFTITTDHPVVPLASLPISAALAVREGLPVDEALKAITLGAAMAGGIDECVGSLKAGKDADIAVFTHHPFDYMAKTRAVVMAGQMVLGG